MEELFQCEIQRFQERQQTIEVKDKEIAELQKQLAVSEAELEKMKVKI